jgi:hypothetical protein
VVVADDLAADPMKLTVADIGAAAQYVAENFHESGSALRLQWFREPEDFIELLVGKMDGHDGAPLRSGTNRAMNGRPLWVRQADSSPSAVSLGGFLFRFAVGVLPTIFGLTQTGCRTICNALCGPGRR